MSIKSAFKKIWHGVSVLEPLLPLLAPLAGPWAFAITALDGLIKMAEEKFSEPGSGLMKSEFVTLKWLAAMEVITGRNVDNPQTRAIVQKLIDMIVRYRNLAAQLATEKTNIEDLVRDVQQAVDSIKAPAQPDEPAPLVAPTAGPLIEALAV